MPEDKTRIYAVLTYIEGEFQRVLVYSTEEKALAAAARHIHHSLDDAFANAVASDPDDVPGLQEFADNLKELFRCEAYKSFVECWDAWVADGDFNGPTPHNFDIEELLIDAD